MAFEPQFLIEHYPSNRIRAVSSLEVPKVIFLGSERIPKIGMHLVSRTGSENVRVSSEKSSVPSVASDLALKGLRPLPSIKQKKKSSASFCKKCTLYEMQGCLCWDSYGNI